MFLATLALFSIGYYCLPIIFLDRSALRYLPLTEVSAVLAMALFYFVALLVGFVAMARRKRIIKGLNFPLLDGVLYRNWWPSFAVSSIITIYYYSSRTLTFYDAGGVAAFNEQQSPLAGIIGFLASFAQAMVALHLAIAIKDRNVIKSMVAAAVLAVQLYLVVNAGQRLIFITPIVLAFAAMIVRRSYRTASIALVTAVVALLIVSPFAVALRSSSWNSQQDIAAKNFSYGDDPVDTVLQSIVDRGDILLNMAALKAHVDRAGYVGPLYYTSVLVIPVPRAIYSQKPHVLSDTGDAQSEASILAWRLVVGPSDGSLTAFGSILAYREGGWIWMVINGLLTGGLFAFLLTTFSKGGVIGQTFFVMAFFNWAVRKAPPSLFEAGVDVMTYLPVIIALFVLNRLLSGRRTGIEEVSHALPPISATR